MGQISKTNRNYTKEQEEFLMQNAEGTPFALLTDQFNKKFNESKSIEVIRQKCKNMKIPNKLTANDSVLFNRYPIGAERIDAQGYPIVKVRQPDTWRRKSYIVWETYHPRINEEDEVIIHLNQERSDCSIDNLMKIEKSVFKSLLAKKLYTEDYDITKAAISVARLKIKIKEIEEQTKVRRLEAIIEEKDKTIKELKNQLNEHESTPQVPIEVKPNSETERYLGIYINVLRDVISEHNLSEDVSSKIRLL